MHLDKRGRGRALAQVWLGSASEVVAYMDVNLSTDLDALHPLVAPLLSGAQRHLHRQPAGARGKRGQGAQA